MVDIARSPEVKRKKQIRRVIYGAVALIAIVLITVGVSRLKPAAPSVDRATVWVDTVKRGPMLRQVRGSGTLVPEDIRWIPATTQRPRRAARPPPGAQVTPDDGHPRAEQPGPPAVGHGCAARLPVGARRPSRTARRTSRASCSTSKPASSTSSRSTDRRA